ncbi:MAG: response regulator [Candidatus Nitrosotalea sp.]|nr:response regulator [Candidatus Nitrosotalea sp.]
MLKDWSLRILVAEDYKDLADSYKMALEERGHLVITTRDGIECLQTYSDYTKQHTENEKPYFDLVILDQNMPGMDGIDVAKEIQKINLKQRIIFITGYGNSLIKKLRQLNETVEVMNKPFTLQALITQIEGWPIYLWREKAKQGFKDWDGYEGTSVPVGPSRTG